VRFWNSIELYVINKDNISFQSRFISLYQWKRSLIITFGDKNNPDEN